MPIEGFRKPGSCEIKWYTSAFGLYSLCQYIFAGSVHTLKKNIGVLVAASNETG